MNFLTEWFGIDRRRLLIGALLVGALIAGSVWVRIFGAGSWQWLVDHEQRVRSWITIEHPVLGWWIGLVIFTAVSFIPGLAGKSLVVGWLYGFWLSLLMVNIGLTVVAIVEFQLARWLFLPWVKRRWAAHLAWLEAAVAREGPFYLFAARVAHAPYTMTNILMGAVPLRVRSFWWATQCGLLPGNVLFCYAGTCLPTLQEISRGEIDTLQSPTLWLALVAIAIAPWLARWIFARLRTHATCSNMD